MDFKMTLKLPKNYDNNDNNSHISLPNKYSFGL